MKTNEVHKNNVTAFTRNIDISMNYFDSFIFKTLENMLYSNK
jgi:hypothetical protein